MHSPHSAAGRRKLPPISEPMPITDPLEASNAHSPPDDPPTPLSRSSGWTVAPNMLLDVSQLPKDITSTSCFELKIEGFQAENVAMIFV